MPNRLAQSTSAYLRSAEHQPIDWYEFGNDAFERARELDRPMLLDIGAVWCHWCHVIDRESYDDPEIAQYLNENFIAIKVDRDQRPDIDARYQQVVASMSGQGGWPLTAFLTHDGRVLYGGTYFPPQTMKVLLRRIVEIYREKRDDIFGQDEMLSDEMVQRAEATNQQPVDTGAPITKAFYEAILKTSRDAFDNVYGGFGAQPKFPHYSTLELLIAAVHHGEDAYYRNILDKTLTEMGKGGVYDQIAGGFHRYSVDRQWHVPHFEKMAYDNAEALNVYAQAYRLTGNRFFREIAEGIISWVDETLSDRQNGGFYASQDADIDLNDDGDHFTWSVDEAREILTPEETELAVRYFDMDARGDMHDRPGRNVLWTKISIEDLASQLGVSPDRAREVLTSAKRKIAERRKTRPIPFIDKTLYVNWNGMFITGYLEAAMLLEHAEAKAFGLKSLDRMLSEFVTPDEGVLHTQRVPGFLDDIAYLAQAALLGYQATGEERYLQAARRMMDTVLDEFEDPVAGGFHDTRRSTAALGLLKFQRKPVEDNPSSSANGIAIQVLQQLALLTGEARYQQSADRALKLFIRDYSSYGLFVGALGVAVFRHINPPLKIELVGQSAELAEEARRLFYPGKLLAYNTTVVVSQPEARLCIGTRCLPPVRTARELSQALERVGSL